MYFGALCAGSASGEVFGPQLGQSLRPTSGSLWAQSRKVFGPQLEDRPVLGPNLDGFLAPTRADLGPNLGRFWGLNLDSFMAANQTVFGPKLGQYLGSN